VSDGHLRQSRTMIATMGKGLLIADWTAARRFQTGVVRAIPYGLSIVYVAIALGLSAAADYYGFQQIALPLLAVAIVLAAWYGGPAVSVLAVVLSAVGYTYFFTDPRYSFEVSAEDVPNFLLFMLWAVIAAWFVTVRRRIEADLRETTDQLSLEVEQRRRREEEVRNLNQELASRAAELVASNKELEAFAYSVSHDLRAPLRHSAGYAELLQKHAASSLDEKSRRYIQTVLDASKRMGTLIDDLLAFSRIGRADPKNSLVNLTTLVQEAVAEIREQTRGRDIVWNIDWLPVCYGDRSMLKLVVTNLVSNAVKFTRVRPQARIEIGSSAVGQNEVEIFVRDNGAGFDMKYVHQLFGVFQRLHLREEFEGTGIGLAIVQRVVHRHGGKVRAEGTVGEGATFYFSLPIAQRTAERTADVQ
jgi:signal transduction histidine kinase